MPARPSPMHRTFLAVVSKLGGLVKARSAAKKEWLVPYDQREPLIKKRVLKQAKNPPFSISPSSLMLSYLTIFTIATSLVSGLAIPHQGGHDEIAKRDTAPLKLDFDVVKDTKALHHPKRYVEHANAKFGKRASSVPITEDKEIMYNLDIYLGSQKEKITVLLDTGSSDLWVYGPDVQSAQGGTFDPKQSSKGSETGEDFSISYQDGSTALGALYKDAFTFGTGQAQLLGFQFAVADKAQTKTPGILGIADRDQESAHSQYDNLPWALQKAGVTCKASYSLFLGSQEEQKGTVIFGGIDTAKYEGQLQKYDLEPNNYLGLTAESASVNGNTIQLGEYYNVDSGTSWNMWPSNLVEAVADALGYSDVQDDLYIIDCNQPTDKNLTFSFGQNEISIPYNDLVISVGTQDSPQCALGAQQAKSEGPFVLGDVFMRSAYVYYDLSGRTISIAQAKYTSDSNVVSA